MKSIAVIFGGRSAEHDVSIVTAISSIIKPLELTKKYKIEPIYIAKDGAWYWDAKLKDINLFTSGKVESFLQKATPVSVQFDGGMVVSKGGGFSGRRTQTRIDLVFPAMHGTFGEDGSLTGLLEMAGVPYVGCGLSASAISMDKVLAKQIAEQNGVSTAKYKYLSRAEFEAQSLSSIIESIEEALSYPLFIKPAHLGSSIGISKAANTDELKNALEVAAHYDDKILIEEEVRNLIEVTLPIIGNNELRYALLERPLTSAEDFFNFDTKYMQGGKKGGGKKGGAKGVHGYSEIPAKLDKALYQKAENLAGTVYRAVGCSGIARVDMLIDEKTKQVYFNEINPLPGDLYRHNWHAAGLSTVELVEELVRLAEERHDQRQKNNTVFDTNYLKQF